MTSILQDILFFHDHPHKKLEAASAREYLASILPPDMRLPANLFSSNSTTRLAIFFCNATFDKCQRLNHYVPAFLKGDLSEEKFLQMTAEAKQLLTGKVAEIMFAQYSPSQRAKNPFAVGDARDAMAELLGIFHNTYIKWISPVLKENTLL